MGLRKLTSWLKADERRLSPLWWLRPAIPVIVLLVILVWVIMVFMNDEFWMVRDTANLPVAALNRHHPDGGYPIRVVVDQRGRLSIADHTITTEELAAILTKCKVDEASYLPTVEIRAEAKTSWCHVQPVLGVLRHAGLSQVQLLTRHEEGIPSYVEAGIDSPPANGLVTITRNGDKFTLNGKPCTEERLRQIVPRLADLDKATPIALVFDLANSVQDVVSVIDICSRIHLYNLHIVEGKEQGK